MKILKKYLQNWKGLQKLDTKHMPHAPKGEKNFEANFVTEDGILKFRYRRGVLWHTKEEVSKKGGLGGQKMKILKKFLQNQKGLQKLGTKHVPHPPKEEKYFLRFLWRTKEEVSKKGG